MSTKPNTKAPSDWPVGRTGWWMPGVAAIPLRAAALALGVAIGGFAGVAQAGTGDYRIEALDPQVRPGRDAELRVRLVRLADGQPVTGAVLDEARIGMWPTQLHKAIRPWMAHAVEPVAPVGAEGGGVHRLRADLGMAGDYRLRLAARVPGEAEPVRGAVKIRAAYR